MAVNTELSRYYRRSTQTIIEYEAERSFLGLCIATANVAYYGQDLPDGTVLWERDDGAIPSRAMEQELNRIHRHYANKKKLG